jgi:REP element-mobilizing transposase RayT
MRHRQLSLKLPDGHGGRRPGAGRKPAGERAGVSHHGRPEATPRFPVHVTLRTLDHVWNLRSRRSFRVVEAALTAMLGWRDFHVVHFSVQGNHLHFVVEAEDSRALAEGMQGLLVRLAKGLNRMMGRHGKVFADRYHAHVLRTPSEVRRALAYVLLNARSHLARLGERPGQYAVFDPYSSAAWFDGWTTAGAAVPGPRLTSPPCSWLLATGWRRHGLLPPLDVPAAPAGVAQCASRR